MTALIRTGRTAEAFAQWSHWVAGCWQCPSGAILQRFQPLLECGFCGAVTEIVWPPGDKVAAIERLLMMRPDPSTRNWFTHETTHDLLFENAEHGILDRFDPDELGLPPGTPMFGVTDFGILNDALPAIKHRVRRELT